MSAFLAQVAALLALVSILTPMASAIPKEAIKRLKSEANADIRNNINRITKERRLSARQINNLNRAEARSLKNNQNENFTFSSGVSDRDIDDEETLEHLNNAIPLPVDDAPTPIVASPDQIEQVDTPHLRTRRATVGGYTYNYRNYVKEGYVTSVKNQGQCGNCYAFGAVAGIESLYKMKRNETRDFSEQHITDCTYKRYTNSAKQVFNNGCNGGNPRFVVMFFNETYVSTEKEKPYNATLNVTNCPVITRAPERVINYAYLNPKSESHLAYLLDKNGPIIIFNNANGNFQKYKSGLYNDGASCNGTVNHVMLLVGVDKDAEGEFWIIKNSWGTTWGEQGYVRFPKDKNMCNIMGAAVTIPYFDKVVL